MKDSAKYSRYFTYIKPVIRSPILKNYGSTIFTLITIIIFIFFAIKPTVETILVLQKKLEDSNQVLEQLKKKATDLTEAKENYDNLDPIIQSKIDTALPAKVTFNSLIETIETIARNNDASISALQVQPIILVPKPEGTAGTVAEIEFSVNIEGLYGNLVSILQELRSNSRVFSITGLTLNKVAEGSGLIMSLSGKAYYLK